MVTFLKNNLSAIVVFVFFATISGCRKDEGAMEKADKKVGESIDEAEDAMEDAAHNAKENST